MLRFLSVRDDEVAQIGPLMIQMALSGALMVIGLTIYSSRLLTVVSPESLPLVFFLIPLCGFFLSEALSRLLPKSPDHRLACIGPVGMLCSIAAVNSEPWTVHKIDWSRALPFIGFWILFSIESSQLNQRIQALLTPWQRQRLIGPVYASTRVGGLLSGLLLPLVLSMVSENGILLVWGSGHLLASLLLVCRFFPVSQPLRSIKSESNILKITRIPLAKALALLILIEILVGSMVVYVINSGLSVHFKDRASELSVTLSTMTGCANLLMLLFQSLLLPWLTRYLTVFWLHASSVMIIALLCGIACFNFSLLAILSLLFMKDYFSGSTFSTLKMSYYQGLELRLKPATIGHLEGSFTFLSHGLASILLLVLPLFFTGQDLILFLCVLCIFGCIVLLQCLRRAQFCFKEGLDQNLKNSSYHSRIKENEQEQDDSLYTMSQLQSLEDSLNKLSSEDLYQFLKSVNLLRYRISGESCSYLIQNAMHWPFPLQAQALSSLSLVPSTRWLCHLLPYLSTRSLRLQNLLCSVLEASLADDKLRDWFLCKASESDPTPLEILLLNKALQRFTVTSVFHYCTQKMTPRDQVIQLSLHLRYLQENGFSNSTLFLCLKEDLITAFQVWTEECIQSLTLDEKQMIRRSLFGLQTGLRFDAMEFLKLNGHFYLVRTMMAYFEAGSISELLSTLNASKRQCDLDSLLTLLNNKDGLIRASLIHWAMNNSIKLPEKTIQTIAEESSSDLFSQEAALAYLGYGECRPC